MSVKNFENKRWTSGDQKISFRHKAALNLITGLSNKEISLLDLGCGDGLYFRF